MNNLESWPAIVRPLVKQYGAWRVWNAGLLSLGYPPTWIMNVRELRILTSNIAQS